MFEYAGQMRPGVLAIALVIAAAPLGSRERVIAHPPDDTEVFTGGEEVAPGEVPRRPALAYWKIRATLRVPAGEQLLHVGLLVPLSDGRQDVLGRRTVAPGFRFREAGMTPNLRAEWTGVTPRPTAISYEVAVRLSETSMRVPETPLAALKPPRDAAAALAPSRYVQSTSPAVVRRAQGVIGHATRLDEVVWSLYQYTAAFRPA